MIGQVERRLAIDVIGKVALQAAQSRDDVKGLVQGGKARALGRALVPVVAHSRFLTAFLAVRA